jgi:hypothetical protein
MTTKHATLGASSSYTWINCPGAIRVAAGIPDKQSPEALEGTNAHAQAEHMLKGGKAAEGPFPDLAEDVLPYVDLVFSLLDEGDVLLVEQTVKFDEWVPGGFGTADAVILHRNGLLTIVDLKFGMGLRVDAPGNSQLRLYALGCVQEHQFMWGIDRVRYIVSQPRLDHEDEETLTIEELLEWGEWVKVKALATLEPDAPVVPGLVQCQWCRARFVCRKRALDVLTVMGSDTLTPADIALVYPHAALAVKWAEDIEASALAVLNAGGTLPGLKIVEGTSRRQMRSDAAEVFANAGLTTDQIYRQKFRTLGELENALGGKKAATPVMKLATFKPVGKPTIVETSDPRPQMNVDVVADFPEGT